MVYDSLGLVYNIGCLVYDCLLCAQIMQPFNPEPSMWATGHSFISCTGTCVFYTPLCSIPPLKAISTLTLPPQDKREFNRLLCLFFLFLRLFGLCSDSGDHVPLPLDVVRHKRLVAHGLKASDLTGAAMGLSISKVSSNKSNLERRIVCEVRLICKLILDECHYLMNLFLVKTKFIGDGQLDREVFVVVVHGRYYNRSGRDSHEVFQNLFNLCCHTLDLFSCS